MTTIVKDFSPITVGDTLTFYSPQFLHLDGSPVDLTSATLSIVFLSTIGTRKVGTGTWTIDNATAGQAHYHYSATDVNTAGTWTLQVQVLIGGEPAHTDTDMLQINQPL